MTQACNSSSQETRQVQGHSRPSRDRQKDRLSQKTTKKAREMVQQLRALVFHASLQLTTISNISPRIQCPLLGFMGTGHVHVAKTYMQKKQTPIYKSF